jgi:hypothetical protein
MPSSHFRFEIRRLVVVDSAGFCYVELPVDQHALLLGSGNLGKSSLLNALRLFLLPEKNFKQSRKKFAFRNARAGQHYKDEESFQHYFPSQRSFLILEVSNPAGTHCQILHRDRDLGYGRIFVPVPYAELRPLFWQVQDDEEGIGVAVPGLSVARVLEQTQKLSKDTVVARDPAKLRSLLFASDLMSRDAMRYCVLPLADLDERKVEALRTLILLLFEMAADDSAMAAAVASIVEADKKFSADELDFDIDQFLRRHEQLQAEHEHLTAVEKEAARFERLRRDYARYLERAKAQGEFAAFREGLDVALEVAREERGQAAKQLEQANNVWQSHKKQARELEQAIQELKGSIKTNRSQLERNTKVKQDGELLVSRYPGMRIEEIVELQREEKESWQNQLNALMSDAEADRRREKLGQEINEKQAQIQRLDARIRGQQWQLHRQLPDDVAAPLQAVQPRLLQASPGAELDPEAKRAITAFARLFEQTGSGFRWFDTEFPAQDRVQEDLEAEKQNLLDKLAALEEALADLAETPANKTDRPQKIERAKRELAAIAKDLELLERLPGAAAAIRDAEADLAENEKKKAVCEAELAAEQEKLSKAEEVRAAAKAALERIEERQKDLGSLKDRVGTLRSVFRFLERAKPAGDVAADITAERLGKIEQALQEFEELRSRILNELRHFAHAGILKDEEGALQYDSPSAGAIRQAFDTLDTLFGELPSRREILHEQIASHNETVASYRQALKVNYEHISRFERRLNEELADVVINDLAEVRLDLHCHPKFQNLVEESEAIDPYSDQLISDAFYERLKVFVAEFFDASSGSRQGYRLTMDQVITGISYRTRKQNQAALDTKGQSTSTTALINLELVRRLLRRVLHPGVALSFPLVLDELANIDVSQVPALLDRLKSQGFNLFAAATHSASPELIHQIGRHCELGVMHTRRPYDAHRTAVFWGGAEGFTTDAAYSGWVSQEQVGLLEGSYE